ncbi:hypothetical protein ABMA28_006561 [Loxostege sticticalis]|uniref:DUF7041 domain-containing protein n=1 Tax=Loxostege sticticalis TaxID=481309 RepID=A0ABD0SNS9_LOXSC
MAEGNQPLPLPQQQPAPAPPATAPHPHEVAGIALSMRVPPFWRDRPRLWFIAFEAATDDLKKSEAQRAQMVIAQLQKEDIEQVCDLLYNPPADHQYTALKERLISVYEESDGKQLQKLLSDMELGDQKPSQLLRRMKTLALNKVPDNTLRLMWMNLLPPHVRSVLVVSDTISQTTALDELAKLADKMLEQHHQVSAVSTVAIPHQDSQYSMQFLVEEIRKLQTEISELKTHRNSSSTRYRNHSRNRQRRHTSPSRSDDNNARRDRSATPSPHCYYHRRFGKNAKRCTTPCSFMQDQKSEN